MQTDLKFIHCSPTKEEAKNEPAPIRHPYLSVCQMKFDPFQKYFMECAGRASRATREIRTWCLCPGCKESPINSHSQQMNGALSLIARDGKVVAPVRKFFQPPSAINRNIGPVAIQQASTFKGFCAKHDNEVFQAVERRPLVPNDEEQVLALHRRANGFEIKNKFDMGAFLDANWRIMKQIGIYPADEDRETYLLFLDILLRADRDFVWEPLWEADPMKHVSYVWRVIPRRIGVSMASVISAASEKHLRQYIGRHINLEEKTIDRPRPSFSLTIVPQMSQTHVVMAWNDCSTPFIDPFRERMSSKDDKVFAGFLNQCVFCLSEDYCLSPDLWDSLSPETKATLEEDLHAEDYRSNMVVPDIIKV